jgi:hypothetical protein
MIDYLNYDEIKTEKIVTDSAGIGRGEMFRNQQDKINDFLKRLLSSNFEIIEITHNDIASETRSAYVLYTITNITYGKLKTPKK